MWIQQVWPWLQLIWINYVTSVRFGLAYLLLMWIHAFPCQICLEFLCDFIVTISICKVDLFQMYLGQSHGFKQNDLGISMG